MLSWQKLYLAPAADNFITDNRAQMSEDRGTKASRLRLNTLQLAAGSFIS